MAETLGLVASVIGVLQLTGTLVSLGYDYIGGAMNASKDIQRLLEELHSLSNVLLTLQDFARDDKGLRFTALQALDGRTGPHQGCKLELQTLQLKLEPKMGLRGKMKSLIWPLKEKETFQHISRLERHKGLFNLALTVDQLTLVKAIEGYAQDTNLVVHDLWVDSKIIEGYVQDTNYLVHDLRSEVSAQSARMKKEDVLQISQKRGIVLDWVYPDDFDCKHLEVSNRRQENTGDWLFQTPEIQEWIKGHPNFMLIWGHGIPGAGKTFLSSKMIDHLLWKIRAQEANCGVAYVYFDYMDQSQQKPIYVLASLVKQLASQSPLFYTEIEKLHGRLQAEKSRKPTFEELYATLLATPKSFDRVFLIFDALDECDPDDQRKVLLPIFRHLAKSINVFVTSRPHPEDVRSSLGDVIQIELLAKERDIKAYVQQMIDDSPRAKRLIGQGQCKDKIISDIADCSKGMFLLVRFRVEHICRQPTLRQILNELQKLKNSSGEERPLDPTYHRVVDSILSQPKNCRELALNALSWLVKARRNLTIGELREAVSVKPGRYELDEWDLPDETTLLDVCASLITIDKNTKIVRLAHYTVQEYLLRSCIPSDADLRVAISCVTYLSFEIFAQGTSKNSPTTRLEQHLLLNYAANQLSVHLGTCDEASTANILVNFLQQPGSIESYVQAIETCECTCEDPECRPECHYTYQGRTPLHIASAIGHSLAVQQLLDKGANISAQDDVGYMALHEAAYGGHDKLVQLLLKNGADRSAKGQSGWTALHMAACRGHDEVVQLLIDDGVDISSRCNNGHTALHDAAYGGHDKVVKLLLENGANISAQYHGGRTALHDAAYGGRDKVVQLLIGSGANTSIKRNNGYTALEDAICSGNDRVIKLLQAEIPARRTKEQELPYPTADGGWEKFAQLFLDNEADISV